MLENQQEQDESKGNQKFLQKTENKAQPGEGKGESAGREVQLSPLGSPRDGQGAGRKKRQSYDKDFCNRGKQPEEKWTQWNCEK